MREGERSLLLFEECSQDFILPELKEGIYDQAFDEIELLGFPLRSPFEMLAGTSVPQDSNLVQAKELTQYKDRKVAILGYYVCRKYVRTVNAKIMYFATWIDSKGHFFDTTHFPNSLASSPLRGSGVYYIEGKSVLDFDFPSVEVTRAERLPYVKDERYG